MRTILIVGRIVDGEKRACTDRGSFVAQRFHRLDLHRRARATDKTLKIYDGLVHDLLHEPEGEKVMGELTAWLEARIPPPPAPVL